MFSEIEYTDIERFLAIEQVQRLDHDGDYFISKDEQTRHWLHQYASSPNKAQQMLERLESIEPGEWNGPQSLVAFSIFFSTKDRLIAENEGYIFAEGPSLEELIVKLKNHIAALKIQLQ